MDANPKEHIHGIFLGASYHANPCRFAYCQKVKGMTRKRHTMKVSGNITDTIRYKSVFSLPSLLAKNRTCQQIELAFMKKRAPQK